MKVLTEDDLWGFSSEEKVLYAKLIRNGSVSLGDLYRVPKQYFSSGVGKVTNIDGYKADGDWKESYWLVDLEAAEVEPEDPCDEDFMEEISS